MKTHHLVLGLCGTLLLLSAGSAAASQREPRFLHFTAKGKHGIYLRDVKKEDLLLWLDGQPVPVEYLGFRDVETDFLFLIENSYRTAEHTVSQPHLGQVNVIDRIRASLMDDFFNRLVEIGPAALVEFSLERKVLQDFTRHDDQLVFGLRKIRPQPSMTDRREVPIGRHLLWAVNNLRHRPAKRKILVLFTKVVDPESYRNLEEYKSVLNTFDIELYVVSFARAFVSGSGYTHEQRMNRSYFRKLTAATSGKLYLSGEHVFMEEFMDDLLVRLANSWTAGFYVTPGEQVQDREVKLQVRSKKVKVTHRKTIAY